MSHELLMSMRMCLFNGRPARFQTSNFIGPYNLHRLLLSGLGPFFKHGQVRNWLGEAEIQVFVEPCLMVPT